MPALIVLAIAASSSGMARPALRHDRVKEICIIAGDIDACAPHDS